MGPSPGSDALSSARNVCSTSESEDRPAYTFAVPAREEMGGFNAARAILRAKPCVREVYHACAREVTLREQDGALQPNAREKPQNTFTLPALWK